MIKKLDTMNKKEIKKAKTTAAIHLYEDCRREEERLSERLNRDLSKTEPFIIAGLCMEDEFNTMKRIKLYEWITTQKFDIEFIGELER